MRFGPHLALTVLALMTVVGFQNCADSGLGLDSGFAADPSFGLANLASRSTSSVLPSPSPSPRPTATPVVTVIPKINSWDDDVYPEPLETNNTCLDDSKFNLCLTYRDPVTANGGAFSPNAFTTVTSTAVQEHKVFRWGLIAPTTKPMNRHYYLSGTAPSITVVTPNATNDFKYAFRNDTNHYVGQLHMFYWMNRERQYFKERAGQFYYDFDGTNQQIALHAYVGNVENAYFSRNDYSINFGYFSIGAYKTDFSLDASVLAHEAGHGDFFFANNGGGSDTVTYCSATYGGNCFCPSKNGCMGAIDEGQADVHAFMLFKGNTAIGSYAVNMTNGFRNAATDMQTQTAQSLFNLVPASGYPGGEIHNMGQVYAAIWYGVWKEYKDAGKEKEIEVLFSEHLTALVASDTFPTAYTVIVNTAGQLYPGAESTAMKASFKDKFSKMGITVQ